MLEISFTICLLVEEAEAGSAEISLFAATIVSDWPEGTPPLNEEINCAK